MDLDEDQSEEEQVNVPEGFETFIRETIVPTFESQRRSKQKQFAVLLLISEHELMDLDRIEFYPSHQPLTSNTSLYMPVLEREFRNYIVARPQRKGLYHAEDIIFEKLDQLWSGYLRNNGGVPPKCFILYTWNVPCSRCTDLIIRSFNEDQYKAVSVIVAATAWWKMEKRKVRLENEQKFRDERFSYINIRQVYL